MELSTVMEDKPPSDEDAAEGDGPAAASGEGTAQGGRSDTDMEGWFLSQVLYCFKR